MTDAEELNKLQLEWALAHGLTPDAKGYVSTVNENLFAPLNPKTQGEFERGHGTELDHKMKAVHSSSALAVNVFDYWRERDTSALAAALELPVGIVDVQFEGQQFPTAIGSVPNLDIVLSLEDGSIIAIESKFCEPYKSHKPGFRDAYFATSLKLWTDKRLDACQSLAEEIQTGEVAYRRLHAEQLLKHLLGLGNSDERWSLWYVWYDDASTRAAEHTAEIADFAARIADDGIGFRAFTYQELYSELLRTCGDEHGAYLDYLGSRYFPDQLRPGFRQDRFTWGPDDVTIIRHSTETKPPSEPRRV